MAANLNSKTPAGTLAYCDYLLSKGYATAAQVNPWRTAVQKVFETVAGDSWESEDWSSIDLDEYLSRFQTLAGAQYKAESITAYKRRIRNAIDAHAHYLTTGRPPTFRPGAKKQADAKSQPAVVPIGGKPGLEPVSSRAADGFVAFPYPLSGGRMASLQLPPRMSSDDVNRLCAFIRTLQDDSPEPRQIPREAGEEGRQAA